MSSIVSGITGKASNAVNTPSKLLVAIIGAGASASVVEVIKSWFPEQTAQLGDETIAAAVGFALFYFGDRIHPLVQSFGFGMFFSSVGAWSAGLVEQVIGMFKKK